MGVADVSGTAEAGQSSERDAEHRVGRGLLSRFIGAVFLVLLGGLLLLDQALMRANEEQAALDAKSTALLAESFVRAHDMLLERGVLALDELHGVEERVAVLADVVDRDQVRVR